MTAKLLPGRHSQTINGLISALQQVAESKGDIPVAVHMGGEPLAVATVHAFENACLVSSVDGPLTDLFSSSDTEIKKRIAMVLDDTRGFHVDSLDSDTRDALLSRVLEATRGLGYLSHMFGKLN